MYPSCVILCVLQVSKMSVPPEKTGLNIPALYHSCQPRKLAHFNFSTSVTLVLPISGRTCLAC